MSMRLNKFIKIYLFYLKANDKINLDRDNNEIILLPSTTQIFNHTLSRNFIFYIFKLNLRIIDNY